MNIFNHLFKIAGVLAAFGIVQATAPEAEAQNFPPGYYHVIVDSPGDGDTLNAGTHSGEKGLDVEVSTIVGNLSKKTGDTQKCKVWVQMEQYDPVSNLYGWTTASTTDSIRNRAGVYVGEVTGTNSDRYTYQGVTHYVDWEIGPTHRAKVEWEHTFDGQTRKDQNEGSGFNFNFM